MNSNKFIKTLKSDPRIIIILIAVVIILLIIIFLFSAFNSGTAVSGAGTEVNPAGQVLTSAVSETSDPAPDLAGEITRFSAEATVADTVVDTDRDASREAFVEDFWRWIFSDAGIPEQYARRVVSSVLESPGFVMELLMILQQDPYTYFLVDKNHALPEGYEPADLVHLTSGAYLLGRDGLMLRRIAEEALWEMASAAAAEGIVFTIGSAYRSEEYQRQVYEREVRTYGRETADRQSAQPGKSQHQLGLTVDFAPISDAFATTQASRWLSRNASRFGWSLSYPEGYEHITGYRWESWHYRYVGRDLAAFIDNYFDGIQQYALRFILAWREQAGEI